MNILVIGSGGREHAIARKMKSSPLVDTVFCAKGNPLMIRDGIVLVDIVETDGEALVQFAKENQVTLTFIGPEVPLFYGVSDLFVQNGLKIFSPSQKAAKIEYSKDYAKQLMKKYAVPTALSQTFTDFEMAKQYVLEHGAPIVVKADGLAAGKGVVVAQTEEEAICALSFMLLEGNYTNANDVPRVVIEEFLSGEEFSLFAFVHGEKYYFAGISQDHKRAYTGDLGPNTGGMGAYSPVPQISQSIIEESLEQVVAPIVKGLVKENASYTGVLYAGLMQTADGIKVIEFNARFGDPETQVVLEQLDSDLVDIMLKILDDKIPMITFKQDTISLGVVVAANGYPGQAETEFSLGGLNVNNSDVTLFGAGITQKETDYVANGGRLFLVASTQSTMQQAREAVYTYLKNNPIDNTFYRDDIGNKVMTCLK